MTQGKVWLSYGLSGVMGVVAAPVLAASSSTATASRAVHGNDHRYAVSARSGGQVHVLHLAQSTEQPVPSSAQNKQKPDTAQSSAPLLPTYQVHVPPQADRAHAVSFVSQKDIEARRVKDLDDILFSGFPGVAYDAQSRLGEPNPASGFTIRGLGRERVSVYVDGIPSQSYNHFHPVATQYTPDMIDRIEIYRTPTGVLDGPNAVGTIHIFTPPVPRHGVDGYLETYGGSYGTGVVNGRVGTGWGSGGITIGGEYRHTDGYRSQLEDGNTINLKLTQDLSPTWTSEWRFNRTWDDYGNVNAIDQPPRFSIAGWHLTDAAVSFDRSGEASNSTIAVYWNRTLSMTIVNAKGVRVNQTGNNEQEYGTRLKQGWDGLIAEGNHLMAGIDSAIYNGTSPRFVRNYFVSPYLHDSQPFYWIADQKTVIDAGLRGTAAGDFGNDVSPEVGLVQHVNSTLALRLYAGKSYQIPRVEEELGGGVEAPNLNLQPADFWDEEIGVNKVFQLFGRKAVFDADFFLQQGSNLIVVVPFTDPNNPNIKTQAQNTGTFYHNGLEASFDYHVLSFLTLHLAETYLTLQNETASTPSGVSATPQQTFDFGFDAEKGPFRLSMQSRYATQLYGKPNKQAKLPDYYVVDVKAIYRLTPHVAVWVAGQNLTNERYQTFVGYPQPGATVFVGVRVAGGLGQ